MTKYLFVNICFLLSFSAFSQNLIPQEKKGKWGYTKQDNPKKFVIKPKFQKAMPFGKGLDSSRAFVKVANQYGIIDTKGKWLLRPTYDSVFEQRKIGETFVLAKKGNENFIINKQGEIVSEGFSSLEPFNKEVFIFSKNKQLGIMLRKNDSYQVILPAEYENLGPANFKNTLFYTKKNNKVRFYHLPTNTFSKEYDQYQTIRIRYPQDTTIKHVSKTYLVVAKDGKRGLIDEEMNEILPIDYQQIRKFNAHKDEILFEVVKQGKRGISNEKGNFLLAIEFDAISYAQPYFVASKQGLLGAYDSGGKQILSHLYEDIRFWNEQNIFMVSKNQLKGLVSLEEKVILPNNYDNLMRISYENPCYVLASKSKIKSIFALENNQITKIHQEDFDDLRQVQPKPLLLIGKQKGKENVYKLENKQLTKTLNTDYDKVDVFNKEYWLVRSKAKNYLLHKNTQELIALPKYTFIKDGEEKYRANKREKKKYAEGQEAGTIYLEQDDKAFFWNTKTQKLIPTEKISPFVEEDRPQKRTNKRFRVNSEKE